MTQAAIKTDPAKKMLSFDDVELYYDHVYALKGVSINLYEGETVALIGANGAGKSSILRAITGLRRIKSGSISYMGERIDGRPAAEIVSRGIAMVPEGRRVLGSMTVRENLMLGATIRRDRAEVAKDIAQVMERFPILGQRQNEAAGRLSGGEQQMLVISRAMLSRPSLLMVDEPSLGLAPRITDQIYEMMKALRQDGMTILVVEQSAERAFGAADRIFVLNGGKVRLSGPTAQMKAHPQFEAAYFGMMESEASDASDNR